MAIDNSDIHHGDFEKIACIAFVSITPALLIARFASRILDKQVGNDDWASLAAHVGFFLLLANNLKRNGKSFTDVNIDLYNGLQYSNSRW